MRIAIPVLTVLISLLAAAGLGRMWVMQQYYVGLDGNQVTIFQGVRGDVLGVPLHDVVQHADLAANDLTESDRSALDNGIVSTNGLEGAQSLVSRLNDRKLKPCPIISPTPAPQPTDIPGVTCRQG